MKIIGLEDSRNPVFNSVTGLSNINYDNSNIRSGQMATEDQIRQLWIDANDLEQRIDYCCRDIVVWKSYVRVIAEGTSIVMSDWLDNVAVGTTRRGMPFTIEFALPHDSTKFFDNRSSDNYIYGFGISVNVPGKATQAQEVFTNNAIGCAYNNTTGNTYCNYSVTSTGYWFREVGTNSPITGGLLNSNASSPKPLPQYNNGNPNNGFMSPENTYYMYKDSTDNKIKIDVKRRDQFADGEYLALFWIQFVLRNGATL